MSNSNETSTYLITMAYGRLSLLEIASVLDSGSFDFKINKSTELVTPVECDPKTAIALIKRMGGSYKIAKVCGESIDELLEGMPLPYDAKFNWTVSGYDCPQEILEETKLSVQDFLKSKSLGKSRFLEPDIKEDEYREGNQPGAERKRVTVSELKLKELYEKVIFPSGKIPVGLDIVAAGGLADTLLFGYTIGASDVLGFEKRDFSRSYQDPTITIGPKLARVLVNLGMNREAGTLLDPFCGLGTILQEGLMTGHNVVGVDISNSNVARSITNLNWIKSNYQSMQRLKSMVKRSNAMSLRKENFPKIDGIATEPILLPKFERNPLSSVANEALSKVAELYERSLQVFREILDKGSRIAITAPAIIDDRGREHKLGLSQMFKDSGYSQFQPNLPDLRNDHPFRVPTSKKKVIQRDVYVMTAG